VPADHVALISRDPELTEEVRRLCAVAGRQLLTPASGGDVARVCRAAALVVVDCDDVDVVSPLASELSGEVVLVARDVGRVGPWRSAVEIGARQVLALPVDAERLLDRLALTAEHQGPAGPVLGVVGGRGGAGASTVAVAVAWSLAERGRAVTLADFDVLGGGLDVALGLERAEGVRWPDLAAARGVVPSAELRARLPRVGGMSVVSASKDRTSTAPRRTVAQPAAALAVVDAARRGGGVVVADLPRWPDETAEAVMASCDALVLVVPAEVRAVTAALSLVPRVRQLCEDMRLVVRVDARARLRERDVAAALDCAPMAVVRTDPGLTPADDRGELIASLRRSRLGRSACQIADLLVGDE
jgi:secretion/DNA translocation related CpaE-like protein